MDSHILKAGNARSWSLERSGVELTVSRAAASSSIVKLDIVLRPAMAPTETGAKRGFRCRDISHSLDPIYPKSEASRSPVIDGGGVSGALASRPS